MSGLLPPEKQPESSSLAQCTLSSSGVKLNSVNNNIVHTSSDILDIHLMNNKKNNNHTLVHLTYENFANELIANV